MSVSCSGVLSKKSLTNTLLLSHNTRVKIALVLHLYQPPTQDEAVTRKIFSQCYLPLIKLIKAKKNVSLTLNIPLSLLEQADKYGYGSWISDVKDLYASERIELTGTAAYHPLLTKLSEESAEKQIVLNEYALGYYFGSRTGFEGEAAVMTKNIGGFFAPECAVNAEVISLVNGLGYNWILVDQTAIPNLSYDGYEPVYDTLGDLDIKIVARNKSLSDMLSFYRGSSVDTLVNSIFAGGVSQVIALDGETFGHHNPEGIDMLEDIINVVSEKGGSFVSVYHLLPEMRTKKIDEIIESTWGASYEDMSVGNAYPYWSGNEIQKNLDVLEKLLGENQVRIPGNDGDHDTTAQPLWFYESMTDTSEETKEYLRRLFWIMKFEHSDKYWWSSKKSILGNPMLFHRGMIERSLAYVTDAANSMPEGKIKDKTLTLVRNISSMLES